VNILSFNDEVLTDLMGITTSFRFGLEGSKTCDLPISGSSGLTLRTFGALAIYIQIKYFFTMAQFGVQDMLRTQLILGMNSIGNGTSGWGPLRNVVLLNLFDRISASFPVWYPSLKSFCCRRRASNMASPPPPPNKEIRATIECEQIIKSSGKTGQPTSNGNNTRMDAVVHYMTTIPAIRNLICMTHHDYLPNEFEAVQVDVDLYFQLTKLVHNEGQLESVHFKLFSYEHEVQYIQAFIDKCNIDYERRMANKLGTSLYFFDMLTQSKNKRTLQNPLPTSHLIYSKHRFQTTRTFDNVFFEQREKVRNHFQFFLNRRDWYEKKGIPYTLGFMFHGDPGCGKTSCVKAIANSSHRHIINIQLSEIKTKSQLRHLFFNDEIHVHDGIKTERYTIPVHERLYVIEDIDAMGDAVLERKWKKPELPKEQKKSADPWMDSKEEEEFKEPIDLSFLLNLLDGTLESSGRILVISSNFPERIDKALIRPGRIDMIVHFRKCNRDILQQMVNSFCDKEIEDWTTADLDYKWSPAEVNQILFRNFGSPEKAIEELKNLEPKDLYGFESTEVPSSYETFMTTDMPSQA